MAKIINFHDIYDKNWFNDTLDVISDLYEVVPFSEIERFYQGKVKSKNIVHLSVDDGHISTYNTIYPALKERNMSASIFVSPKIIKEKTNFWYFESSDYDQDKLLESIADVLKISSKFLINCYPNSIMKTLTLEKNWEIIDHYLKSNHQELKTGQYISQDQLLELEKSGIILIGAHTMNHPILTNESDKIATYEVHNSISQLSELLDREVDTFAYPNGSIGLDFGRREMNLLKNNGIKYAFSFEYRDLRKNDDLFSIPRYGLYHGNKDFIRKKLKYGHIWEPIKKILFNNEDKHRNKVNKILKQNGFNNY